MDYINLLTAKIPTSILVIACIAIVILSLMLMRKMTVNENKKILYLQAFALANPDKIEKIKLVDRQEVYCVATIEGKGAEIIAYGVQAVRVFDQLILANPQLAK